MRLAVFINTTFPCPPGGYGGNEMQADILVRGMMGRGHDVDLYCGPGSECPATGRFESAAKVDGLWENLKRIREVHQGYDCIVDSSPIHAVSLPSGLPDGSRTLAMMLGDPYRAYPHDEVRNRVYASREFAEFNGCPGHPVVHNIVHEDPASVRMGNGSGGYVAYVGTIRPEKGVHVAASACRQLDVPFRVAGVVQERFRPYWESFKDQAEFVGEAVGEDKWDLLRAAAATAMPIDWCDAGPLTVMESLLVGTPVVACPMGGLLSDMPKCGGALADRQNFARALHHVLGHSVDRQAMREAILPRIDVAAYLDRMEALCARVAKGESW